MLDANANTIHIIILVIMQFKSLLGGVGFPWDVRISTWKLISCWVHHLLVWVLQLEALLIRLEKGYIIGHNLIVY